MNDADDEPQPEGRRLAWALTGSGHDFVECLELMRRIGAMDVFLSKAAAEVIYLYTKDREPFPDGNPADQGHLGQRRPGRAVLPRLVPHAGHGAGDLEHGGQMRGRDLATRWSPTCSPRPANAACRPSSMPATPSRCTTRWPGWHGPPVAAADRSREHRAAEGLRGDDGGRGHGGAGAGGDGAA